MVLETSSKYKVLLRDFPSDSVVKNPPFNVGDMGLIPGQGSKIPYALEQLSPHVPQLLKPVCSGAHTPQSTHCKETPCTLQLRSNTAK